MSNFELEGRKEILHVQRCTMAVARYMHAVDLRRSVQLEMSTTSLLQLSDSSPNNRINSIKKVFWTTTAS
jgi:hypothetical protein